MIVISHRGAAGLAPENTLEGIDEAKKAGVDKIEVDIRISKDKRLVLFHDQSMYRITGKSDKISDLSLKEINITSTHSGHPIPSLEEALEHSRDIPLFIDCRGKDWPSLLANTLKKHSGPKPSVSCSNQRELFEFSQLMPDVNVYLSNLTKPFSALFTARTLGFKGVSLNFWTLNPFLYFYTKRFGLDIIAYTVNRPTLARFLHFLYPRAQIVTDFPDRLSLLSNKRRRTSK